MREVKQLETVKRFYSYNSEHFTRLDGNLLSVFKTLSLDDLIMFFANNKVHSQGFFDTLDLELILDVENIIEENCKIKGVKLYKISHTDMDLLCRTLATDKYFNAFLKDLHLLDLIMFFIYAKDLNYKDLEMLEIRHIVSVLETGDAINNHYLKRA